MSYLCGPLTRGQIKVLMDPLRGQVASAGAAPDDNSAAAVPVAASALMAGSTSTMRPILPPAIREEFATIQQRMPDGYRLEYRPGLLGRGKVHFVQAGSAVDEWHVCSLLQTVRDTPPDDIWDGAADTPQDFSTEAAPDERAAFADLPSELALDKSYTIFERHLKEHLYREQVLALWKCEALETVSQPAESESDFRARLTQAAAARLEAERAALEKKQAADLAKIDEEIERKQAKRNTQRWQFFAKLGGILWAIFEAAARIAGVGRRGRPRSAEVAFRQAATERGQQTDAEIQLRRATEKRERLVTDFEAKQKELEARFAPQNLQLDRFELKPRKADIEIDRVALVWLPWRVDSAGQAEPVY
jgi:hypothetical protein